MHHIGQLLYHAFICAEIVLLGQHDAKVEDKFIPVIARGLHANWVAQDPVSICANLEKVAAELLARDDEERDVGEGQEEGLRWCGRGGDDRSIGDLVDDLRPCGIPISARFQVLAAEARFPTLLGVEFAVEDCLDHRGAGARIRARDRRYGRNRAKSSVGGCDCSAIHSVLCSSRGPSHGCVALVQVGSGSGNRWRLISGSTPHFGYNTKVDYVRTRFIEAISKI